MSKTIVLTLDIRTLQSCRSRTCFPTISLRERFCQLACVHRRQQIQVLMSSRNSSKSPFPFVFRLFSATYHYCLWFNIFNNLFKVFANERNESLLSNCRVQLKLIQSFCKYSAFFFKSAIVVRNLCFFYTFRTAIAYFLLYFLVIKYVGTEGQVTVRVPRGAHLYIKGWLPSI